MEQLEHRVQPETDYSKTPSTSKRPEQQPTLSSNKPEICQEWHFSKGPLAFRGLTSLSKQDCSISPPPFSIRGFPLKSHHMGRVTCASACCPSLALTWTAGLVFIRHKGAMWHVQNSLPPPPTINTPDRPDLPPLHHTPLVGACLRSALLPTHGLIYFDKAKNGKLFPPPMCFGHPCPFSPVWMTENTRQIVQNKHLCDNQVKYLNKSKPLS